MLDKDQFEVPDSGEIPRTLSSKLAIAITHELDKSLQKYYRVATALENREFGSYFFQTEKTCNFAVTQEKV